MSNKRLSNVSVLRILAFLSVFFFHSFFFGTVNMAGVSLLMLLAAAVQVFLFISGFLYSQKNVLTRGFLLKEFKKILYPCLGFLGVLAIADFVMMANFKSEISWNAYWWTFGSKDSSGNYVAQFANLWYIPCLLICYLILPFLQWFRSKAGIKGLVILFVIETVAEGISICFFGQPQVAFPFIAGYLIGSAEFRDMSDPHIRKNWFWYAWPVLLSVLWIVGWWALGPAYPKLPAFWGAIVHWLFSISTGFVGISLAITLLRAFRFLNAYPEPKALRFLGGLTFWLYIVHETFMSGCFDLLHACPSWGLGVLAAFGATLLTSIVFTFFGKYIRQRNAAPSALKLVAR